MSPGPNTVCLDYLLLAFTFHGDGRLTELRVSPETSEPEYCEHASGDWTFVEGGDLPASLTEECASLDPTAITGTLTMDRDPPDVRPVCTLFDGHWLWMEGASFLRGEGVNVGSCGPSGGAAGTGGGAINDLSCSTPGQMSVPGSANDPCDQDDPACAGLGGQAVNCCLASGQWQQACSCRLPDAQLTCGPTGIMQVN